MTMSHHPCLSDDILETRSEKYFLLQPYEKEWILEGLTSWVDSMEESDVNLVHVDGI